MKPIIKNELDVLDLIKTLQSRLIALDGKVDILISRSLQETRPASGDRPRFDSRNHEHHMPKMSYKATCSDCKKECGIPFKPTGDRPVYCQDCFSKRKVIRLSKIGMDDNPRESQSFSKPALKSNEFQKHSFKDKKKAPTGKKPVAKKRPVSKKK